jgi:hypothetical protein
MILSRGRVEVDRFGSSLWMIDLAFVMHETLVSLANRWTPGPLSELDSFTWLYRLERVCSRRWTDGRIGGAMFTGRPGP